MAKKHELSKREQELLKDFITPPKPKREEGGRCHRCGEWLGGGGKCANGH